MRARIAAAPRVVLSVDRALGLDAHVRVTSRVGGAELGEGRGELALGRLDETDVALVVAPDGGNPRAPIRLARLLGAETLLTAVLARATEPTSTAEVAVVQDHLGLLVPNPLVGPNPEALGARFPDLSAAYDPALAAAAREIARGMGAELPGGVYAAHPEPNLATPAEYRMLRRLGADWVGRGGVPEAILARHAGMRVVGLLGAPGSESRLAALVRALVGRLAGGSAAA